MTTARPTRYESGDSGDRDSRSRGGGAGLIAASIVAAGFLLGLGLFLALTLRGSPGTGTASETPSFSAPESGAGTASRPPPSGESSAVPTASMAGDPLGEYVGRLESAFGFHQCTSAEAPSPEDVDRVYFLEEVYDSAISNRRCLVQRFAVSLHGFASVASMNAAYEAAVIDEGHLGHTASCEAEISSGAGNYEFPDGRQGRAVCLLHSGGYWIMWTDEAANVLVVIYATDTTVKTGERLKDFWRDTFSLRPSS